VIWQNLQSRHRNAQQLQLSALSWDTAGRLLLSNHLKYQVVIVRACLATVAFLLRWCLSLCLPLLTSSNHVFSGQRCYIASGLVNEHLKNSMCTFVGCFWLLMLAVHCLQYGIHVSTHTSIFSCGYPCMLFGAKPLGQNSAC